MISSIEKNSALRPVTGWVRTSERTTSGCCAAVSASCGSQVPLASASHFWSVTQL